MQFGIHLLKFAKAEKFLNPYPEKTGIQAITFLLTSQQLPTIYITYSFVITSVQIKISTFRKEIHGKR